MGNVPFFFTTIKGEKDGQSKFGDRASIRAGTCA